MSPTLSSHERCFFTRRKTTPRPLQVNWARKRLPSEDAWESAAQGELMGKRSAWGDDSRKGAVYKTFEATKAGGRSAKRAKGFPVKNSTKSA